MKTHQPTAVEMLDAEIARRTGELQSLVTARGILAGALEALAPTPPAAVRQVIKRRGRRVLAKGGRIAPGSMEDRILEVLREVGAPVKMVAIEPKVGASRPTVQKVMNELIAAGRVVATGATTSRRYGLPGKG